MNHNQKAISQKTMLLLTLEELAKCKAIQLHDTYAEILFNLGRIKVRRAWLDLAIAKKYDKEIAAKRDTLNQHSGIVQMLVEDDVIVSNTVKETINWDQKSLESIIQDIAELGYSANQFIDISYTVPESKYHDYPEAIQDILLPHKQIALSKSKYKLTVA